MEQRLNLIEQLQATPKWKKFEDWYEDQQYDIPFNSTWKDTTFIETHFHFQKGVFEKFVESQGFIIEQWYNSSTKKMCVNLFIGLNSNSVFEGTFIEFLIWYFNN